MRCRLSTCLLLPLWVACDSNKGAGAVRAEEFCFDMADANDWEFEELDDDREVSEFVCACVSACV